MIFSIVGKVIFDMMKNDEVVINVLHWLTICGKKGLFTLKFLQVPSVDKIIKMDTELKPAVFGWMMYQLKFLVEGDPAVRVTVNVLSYLHGLLNRYLTVREQRLRTRRMQAEELLAWKDQLDNEEKAVRHFVGSFIISE